MNTNTSHTFMPITFSCKSRHLWCTSGKSWELFWGTRHKKSGSGCHKDTALKRLSTFCTFTFFFYHVPYDLIRGRFDDLFLNNMARYGVFDFIIEYILFYIDRVFFFFTLTDKYFVTLSQRWTLSASLFTCMWRRLITFRFAAIGDQMIILNRSTRAVWWNNNYLEKNTLNLPNSTLLLSSNLLSLIFKIMLSSILWHMLRVRTVAKRHMRFLMFTVSFILVSCVKLP